MFVVEPPAEVDTSQVSSIGIKTTGLELKDYNVHLG